MKRITNIITLVGMLSALALSAAVPIRWTVETSRVQPAQFESFKGESITLEAAMQSYGKPLAIEGEPHLYWQTNGMGAAWWTAPAAVSSNVLSATWTPEMDCGATAYTCFLGVTGSIYRAAFQLRVRHAPGDIPNELPLPTPTIDFDRVTVLHPPWPGIETVPPIVSNVVTKSYVESLGITGSIDTNAVTDIANAAISTNATVSNKADRTELDHYIRDGGYAHSINFYVSPTAPNVAIDNQYIWVGGGVAYNGEGVLILGDRLQPYSMVDGYRDLYWPARSGVLALTDDVAESATAATNYTDSATNGLLRVETDPTIALTNRTLTVHGQDIEIPDASGWSLDPVTNTVDVAIGMNAKSDSAGVAIGYAADARDFDPSSVEACVAVGNISKSHGGFSVAVGGGAEAWYCGTVVGQASWAHQWGLALGKSAFAINKESMVLNALEGLTYTQSPSNCHKDHGTNTVNIWCTDDPNRIYFNNKTLATMMSEASVEFDPTDPVFSNAVLSVALGGIDMSEFPVGTAATVGGLLAALVAAYVALKKRADETDEKLAMVKQVLELVNGEDSSGVTVLYAEDGKLTSDVDSIEEEV